MKTLKSIQIKQEQLNSLLMEKWGYGKKDEAAEEPEESDEKSKQGYQGPGKLQQIFNPPGEGKGNTEDIELDDEDSWPELAEELKEGGGFITFSDGYKFKEVSKSFAASNWDKVEVYGIDISSESESLIDSIDDLNQTWDAFGIEAGGSLEAEELEETHGHAGKGCDEAHPDEEHEDYMDRLTIRRG